MYFKNNLISYLFFLTQYIFIRGIIKKYKYLENRSERNVVYRKCYENTKVH